MSWSPLLRPILYGPKKSNGHTSRDDVGEGGQTGTLFEQTQMPNREANQSSYILWTWMPSDVNDMMSEWGGGAWAQQPTRRLNCFPMVTAREHKRDDTCRAKSIV